MSLSALEYLRHILDETEYLTRQARKLTRERFVGDETFFACATRFFGLRPQNDTDTTRNEFTQRCAKPVFDT
jgi:hypothetical protein